jgi:hypothetical protein
MKDRTVFAEGLGTGAALIVVVTAAACLWQANRIAAWLTQESEEMRRRRQIERAQLAAKLSPDYLDTCRAAGI